MILFLKWGFSFPRGEFVNNYYIYSVEIFFFLCFLDANKSTTHATAEKGRMPFYKWHSDGGNLGWFLAVCHRRKMGSMFVCDSSFLNAGGIFVLQYMDLKVFYSVDFNLALMSDLPKMLRLKGTSRQLMGLPWWLRR